MSELNSNQEVFAQEVVRNGGNKVEAFKVSGWAWENYTPAALSVQADKKYNHPKINLRIIELKKIADSVAQKEFEITIEQRLKWLKEVAEAGLGLYIDAQGGERRENLGAVTQAVNVMNKMLEENQASSTDSLAESVGKLIDRLPN